MIKQPSPLDGIPQNIVDRIKKLIDLQDGAAAVGSLAEAENAARRISELLLKWNLEMADFDGIGISEKNPVVEHTFDMNEFMTRHEAGWAANLLSVLAHFNLCKAIIIKGYAKNHNLKYSVDPSILIGKKHNVEILKYLFAQLVGKIQSAGKIAWKEYKGSEKRNTYFRGYYEGAVMGIRLQLVEQRKELLKTDEVESGKGKMWGLIKNNDEAVDKWINDRYKVNEAKPKKGSSSMDGLVKGYEDGKNMQINSGLNDAERNQAQLN